uniref:Tetratricopeptide repeat-containing protein n=1 Tax=Candidatus Kentrum eta TaxID=2126337 RepID=A0A450VBQ5_9GAMM|nr:MAG: hypothetical protein BECKH772A_GA0070896_100884 [Candidatus Kentron sp. H]VFJ96343.1 MAG: hypothetical protein BECKH772B_GA0070898_100904 [Candidatus Kentron sp. H]VFK02232.1 MAG: hypothetical protein BECKH772C_GA0070978_100854 [Candidatus Kentron sp. H]
MAGERKRTLILQWLNGLKDISVIVSIIALSITMLTYLKEGERIDQNTAVAKSITTTMQRINQDIVFRHDENDIDIGSILQEYSQIASSLAPNDPFVVTYAMYTRLMMMVRNPKTEDANELLALSIFPDELKSTYPQYSTIVDGLYEDWMLYSGVGMLNLIVKGRTTSRSQEIALFDRSFEVLDAAFSKASQRRDQRRVLSVGSVLIQHALRGAQFKLPPKGSWDAHLKKSEDAIKLLMKDGSDKALISALDGKANIAHLKGQYFHVQGQWESALRYYEESLAAYDELAMKYPQRVNPVEVTLVKQHIDDATNKREMGAVTK